MFDGDKVVKNLKRRSEIGLIEMRQRWNGVDKKQYEFQYNLHDNAYIIRLLYSLAIIKQKHYRYH